MRKLTALLGTAAVACALLLTATGAVASGNDQQTGAPLPGAASAGSSGDSKLPAYRIADTQRTIDAAGGATASITFNGCADLYLALPVYARQPVAVSASEMVNGVEWMGSAWIDVRNVRVISGGVQVRLCVDWGSPLPISIHYVWA
ncbi:hypothetical protein F4553_001256 [Allocatelliglobosispora scoriae]|uniref:Uncharacterized protein n=1 Tax=Allocatelliglobosispora scoriae TaxID=643052 RepID=A0A841BFL1_9ACTN|nr:hypothetical protein [Allocatelliglobosispora scoriae]MBB5867877.1 hypothetical protein [Allocatelliglobosispora scoriae]